jgi:anti-anti-sigma factor
MRLLPQLSQADFSPAGPLVLTNAADLRARLFALLERAPRVVTLALDAVTALDGAGLAVLLDFAMACAEDRVRIALIRPSSAVVAAFEVYGLVGLVEGLSLLTEDEGLLVIVEDDFDDSVRLDPVRLAC